MAFFPVEYVTRSPDASPGVHANGIDRAADRVTARRACAAAGVMLAAHYVVAFVLFLSLPFIYVDASSRVVDGVISLRHVNATHVALVTFNAVNALICVWEIALWCHRERVKKLSRGYIKKFGDRVLPKPLFLFQHISLREALSLEYWSIVFAQYASLDPSYVEHNSWSFWVDCGNGFTTLAPTLALSVGITRWPAIEPIISASPRMLGLLAVVVNYQMAYGTVLYFANYAYNGYYRGASNASLAIVGVSNVLWILFPAMWIVIGVRAVNTGVFAPILCTIPIV